MAPRVKSAVTSSGRGSSIDRTFLAASVANDDAAVACPDGKLRLAPSPMLPGRERRTVVFKTPSIASESPNPAPPTSPPFTLLLIHSPGVSPLGVRSAVAPYAAPEAYMR